MKKIISFYLVIAVLWWIGATIFGVNSLPGRSIAYNLGRNVTEGVAWPITAIKSPFALFEWAVSDKRKKVFQNAFDGCMRSISDKKACDCITNTFEKRLTEAEMEAGSISLIQGKPVSEKYTAATNEIGQICQ